MKRAFISAPVVVKIAVFCLVALCVFTVADIEAAAPPRDGIIYLGQSNAMGGNNTAISSTNIGLGTRFGSTPLQLDPSPSATQLVSETECPTGQYPNAGTSPQAWLGMDTAGWCAPFANSQITDLDRCLNSLTGRTYHHMSCAVGGKTYAQLQSYTGGCVNQIESFGARYPNSRVVAQVIVHGESDDLGGTTGATYQSNLLSWSTDLNATLARATKGGRSAPMTFIQPQYSQWTSFASKTTSPIPDAQRLAARAGPSIYLVAPSYTGTVIDTVHWSGVFQRAMGWYTCRAMKQVLYDGKPWRPLEPLAVARSTTNIVVDFNVPCTFMGTCGSPRMAIDGAYGVASTLTDPGTAKGFEYSGATITNVQLCTAADTPITGCFADVTCTGAAAPRASCEFAGQGISGIGITINASAGGNLAYAKTGTSGQAPPLGARGLLRDTSTLTVPDDSYRLFNHGVEFDTWVVP